MKFSQRIGKSPSVKLVQHETIDEALMNSLWSVLMLVYFDNVKFEPHYYGISKHSSLTSLLTLLWLHYFKKPIDEIPHQFSITLKKLRVNFLTGEWYEQLDFLEACAKNGGEHQKKNLIDQCNHYFKLENSAYRFVNGELSEITSEVEIKSVEQATNVAGNYGGVREHLARALQLMNDRNSPDYRNSIKESISAVESLARVLSGVNKAALGQALKQIEKKGSLHPALKSAFSSLYGYTNDSSGIRHALSDGSTHEKSDARFMLVSCSAFVNYLIDLNGE